MQQLAETQRSVHTEKVPPAADTIIEEMTKTIVEAVRPRKVILFGFRARGDSLAESDVDILVIEDEPFGPGRSRRKEMARL
jgi:uncharacterized protein